MSSSQGRHRARSNGLTAVLCAISLLVGSTAGSSPVRAASATTWTGAVDGDWNTAGNWTDGVPDAGDAFIGSGATVATSADVPDFHRLNLQNTSGLLTIGHAMTLQRLDDLHAGLAGDGTSGKLRISTGGDLTLSGDASGDLFYLYGDSAISTASVEGGSLTATDATQAFRVGGPGNQGTEFTLDSGAVDIAGIVRIGSGGSSSKGTMDLDGGTFEFGGSFVVEGSRGGGAGGELNIDGATVTGNGDGRHFNVAAATQAGDYGLVHLASGSLTLGTDTQMSVGPTGSSWAPASSGRFVISGGDFHAPGEDTLVRISSYGGSPTSTATGIPTAGQGAFHQSDGTAQVDGELRIGSGPPSSTTGGFGVYVHRGGDMTVSNSSGTGLLRVAIWSEMTISGGTITADEIQVDAPSNGSSSAGFLQGGGGTLVGPVDVAGNLSPGFQASFPQNTTTATLDIHGDLTLASTAQTLFDFKDPTLAGSFDRIRNDGTDATSFDGTLTLRFFGDQYEPGTVTIFEDFASYSGAFDDVVVTGLTNGETATFDPTDGSVTIEAAPPPPSMSIDDVSVTEGDTGSADAVFTVTLSEASADPVSVDYDTADGTATAGSDYTAASGTLTIPAGQLDGTITIAVLGDNIDEPDETFLVDLSDPVSGTIDDGRGQGTILDDDDPPIVEPPPYDFAWAAPTKPLPKRNRAVADRTTDVRFSLGGDFGLDILAERSPLSRGYDCRSGTPIEGSRRLTRPLGAEGLSYEASSGIYTYAWEVQRTWLRTCRELILRLADGSVERARFRIVAGYQFAFVAPTQARPALNEAVADEVVRVRFELSGDWGTSVAARGFPRSRQIDCSSGVVLGAATRTRPFGADGIRYRPQHDDYVYRWSPAEDWSGTCRRWVIRPTDGQRHTADFYFNDEP